MISSSLQPPASSPKGYTLIELIVAVGLFALVMTLATGAYLIMINVNRQVQATATGTDNLAFALETMARSIRTGYAYECAGGDCPDGSNRFSFSDSNGESIEYFLDGGTIYKKVNGVPSELTDIALVSITSLQFYAVGTTAADNEQARVTMLISGTVSAGPNRLPEPFSIETSATMRGSDI